MKPVELLVAEFEKGLTELVNNSNLPPFIVSLVLSNISKDVARMTEQAYQNAKAKWEGEEQHE